MAILRAEQSNMVPCQIRGADREEARERPVLSVAQVVALADAVPPRF